MNDIGKGRGGGPAAPGACSAAGQPILSERWLIALIAFVAFVRLATLGAYPLLDQSEGRYALIGLNMLMSGDWITPSLAPGEPYLAKPPLSFWLTALSLAFFGVNEFAARLPEFLLAVGVCYLVFLLGAAERGRRFGLVAASVFASSGLAFYLGGTVMPDMTLTLTVTLAMTSFWFAMTRPARAWGYLFFAGLGLALLAKGPIGIVLTMFPIAAWLLWRRELGAALRRLPWVGGSLLMFAIVLPWYALAEMRTPGFLDYFIVGEHIKRYLVPGWSGDRYGVGRTEPMGMVWIFAGIAALPWSLVVAFAAARKSGRAALRAALDDRWLSYLALWFLAELLFFTFARNIILTYVAPAMPAFALLAAHAIERTGLDARRWPMTAAALAAPALALALIAMQALYPESRFVRTQVNIVKKFDALSRDGDGKLVYLVIHPYSARFYTRGAAIFGHKPDQILSDVREPNTYFVVPEHRTYHIPPDLRGKMTVIGSANGFLLLQPPAR